MNKASLMKAFRIGLLIANSLSLVLNIIYAINQASGVFWNISGLFLLLTLVGNIVYCAFAEGKDGIYLGYLISTLPAVLAVFAATMLASLTVGPGSGQNPLSFILIFALLIFGGAICFLDQSPRKPQPGVAAAKPSFPKKIFRNAGAVIMTLIMLSAIPVLTDLFTVDGGGLHILQEVLIPGCAVFTALFYLGTAAILVRVLRTMQLAVLRIVAAVTGLAIFLVLLLPMLAVGLSFEVNNLRFRNAFGETAVSHESLMRVPFSIPAYFYGQPLSGSIFKENILFYEGTSGVDKGIKLYCDVYLPADNEGRGKHSVLVRIHGGGWVFGDKGMMNFPQINRYFAGQGYCVFDIQYGVCTRQGFMPELQTPSQRRGDFTMDDIVRHVGIFTRYLENHAEEFNANLQSVFISGGSAGGHLTAVAGLLLKEGGGRSGFSKAITVRGIIPFYPAIGLAKDLGISGDPELIDPGLLATAESPPCLIYQGTHDGLVAPKIAERFRERYLARGNSRCAVIQLPFGGHGSDLYFAGYYNQSFLFFMERFMATYR